MNAAKAELLDRFASPRLEPGAPPCRPSAEMNLALDRDERYQRLLAQLAEAGFFAPTGASSVARAAAFVLAFTLAFGALLLDPSALARVVLWALLGFVLVQGCFFAHEAMHGAVSRRPVVREAVGQLFCTLLVGFSFSYFCRSHELHHFHCNEEAVDPDAQSTLFSVFASSARSKRGLGRLATRFQHVLIPALYPLWALAMQWDALTFVVRNDRRTRADQVALLMHVVLWFVVAPHFVGLEAAFLNYLGRSVFAGLYLAIVIPINHVARPTVAQGSSSAFLDQQISCTRNLGSSALMDFLFMGLNNHIEHHLFPWVPTRRLRRGRAITRAFCVDEGLPYHEQTFRAATFEVMRHLALVARVPGGGDVSVGQAAARGSPRRAPDRAPPR